MPKELTQSLIKMKLTICENISISFINYGVICQAPSTFLIISLRCQSCPHLEIIMHIKSDTPLILIHHKPKLILPLFFSTTSNHTKFLKHYLLAYMPSTLTLLLTMHYSDLHHILKLYHIHVQHCICE